MHRLTNKERIFIGSTLIVAVLILLCLAKAARAEPQVMRLDRIVPPGAQLTYSENGQVLRTISVPEGHVSVVITFGGGIALRHRGASRHDSR